MKRKLLFTTVEIFTVTIILGVLVRWQADNRENIAQAQSPEAQEVVAVEVARLTNANADLRNQLADLAQRDYDLAQAQQNKQSAKSAYQEEQAKADLVTGRLAVKGPGVRIVINDTLTNTQITDVLNALKNIGAEAIAINGRRITPWFSEWRVEFQPPYTIEAIGSPPVLSTSLQRRGGVIDQIELAAGALDLTVTEQDTLTLPAAPLQKIKYEKSLDQ